MFMNDDYFGCHCVSRGIACFQLLLIVISQNNHLPTIFKWHKTVKRETIINKKPHLKLLIVCRDVIVKSSWCRLLCFSHARRYSLKQAISFSLSLFAQITDRKFNRTLAELSVFTNSAFTSHLRLKRATGNITACISKTLCLGFRLFLH